MPPMSQYWLFEQKNANYEWHPGTGRKIPHRRWGVIKDTMIDLKDSVSAVYRTPDGTLHRENIRLEEISLVPTTRENWETIHDLILWQDRVAGEDYPEQGQLIN